MALATLSIDLVAQLANLQAGMDQAGRIAEKNATRIEKAFGGLKLVAATVGAAFAGALAASGIQEMVRATINGVDHLNDLRDATGATIENLSALEDIGARTGTSIDTVGEAVVKLNKTLQDAKAGSEQAAALKLIGVNAEELKKLDPAEALLRVSKALAGFADDGQKARLVQVLFGKSVQEVGPFLKDLAEAGQLNATVTTEQAKAAEQFNQELAKISKNSQDSARRIVGDFVPALNEILKTFSDKGLLAALDKFGNLAFDWENNASRKQLKLIESDLEDLQKRASVIDSGVFDKIGKLGGAGMIGSAITDTKESLAAQIAALQAKREALIGTLIDAQSPGPRLGVGAGSGAKSVGAIPDAAAAQKRLDEYLKLVAAQAAGEEQAAKDTTEAWQAWEAIQLKDHKESTEAWALQWKQVFDEIDAEQDRAIEEGRILIEGQVGQVSEFAQQAARNIQDALGETIYQGLSGKFSDIGRLWQDLLLRMAAQAASARIGSYLFGDDFAKTGKVGGAIGNLGSLAGGAGAGFDLTNSPGLWSLIDGFHAKGLNYVPFDGYRAVLHKGERVQTAAAARGSESRTERAPTIFQVNVQGDASENTISLIQGAMAQMRLEQGVY